VGPIAEQSKSGSEDRVQRPKPLTDFYGEDRHQQVQKLAYQYWEKRGSPLWSPEIIGSRPKRPRAHTF
jgi:hypothetical protein